jgi:selenocysteine lyase/cysteine desulfurase
MLGIEMPRGCAQTLGRRLSDRGIVASIRGSALRIAPHLHNTPSEVDLLNESLAATE